MSRILIFSIGFLVCLYLVSSQPRDTHYWRLNFDQSPRQHAHAASLYGVGEASHFLAEDHWRQQRRAQALVYYQRAVEQGDAGAAYDLAQRIPAQREQWLRAAVELGDSRATLMVAERLRSSDPAAAVSLLKALADSDARNEMLASLLFNHPHLINPDSESWQTLAPSTSIWQQRRQQADTFSRNSGYSSFAEGPCDGKITLYYHGDRARSTAYDWLKAIETHPFAELGLCFTEATVVAASTYECGEDSVGRASCQGDSDDPDTDFTIHVVSEGSANVRANQMAISQTATFDVFIHELAHLFSLADEYPMRQELALAFCSGRYRFSALNLVITPESMQVVDYEALIELKHSLPWLEYLEQPIAAPVLNKDGDLTYQLGSPSQAGVGLFRVGTCLDTGFQAWRPVAEQTFMEQHESGKVPAVYIEVMREYLQGIRESQH